MGFMDDLEWEDPIVREIPKIDMLNYNKDLVRGKWKNNSIKIFCDLNRICELEDAVVEWYEEKYYQLKKERAQIDFLFEGFNVKQAMYAGVDGAICKLELIAAKPAFISKEYLGVEINVRGDYEEEYSCELK